MSLIDLKREIRKKTIQIYELEEKVESKDCKIHELQLEKAKMRMTFDQLRGQIEYLKDIEAKYNKELGTSLSKSQKSVLIQTEEDDSAREPLLSSHDHIEPRHLDFNTADSSFMQDLSEINNTSTDNLIPAVESETFHLQSDISGADPSMSTITTNSNNDKKKKSKRKFKLFKLMQCISGKTQD